MLSAKTDNGFVTSRRRKNVRTFWTESMYCFLLSLSPLQVASIQKRREKIVCRLQNSCHRQTNRYLLKFPKAPRPVLNLALHFYVVLWKHPDTFEDEVLSQVVTIELFSEHFLSMNTLFLSRTKSLGKSKLQRIKTEADL